MIEHRNVWRLVRAEGSLFAVRPEDRVYQGASLSFDLSVEEVWLAFHAGATLVAATPEMARAGPDLSRLLTEGGVTVLSCVPTLLAMLSRRRYRRFASSFSAARCAPISSSRGGLGPGGGSSTPTVPPRPPLSRLT